MYSSMRAKEEELGKVKRELGEKSGKQVWCGSWKLKREGMSRGSIACLQTGKLALLAILVASGIVLQVLACAVYNNWWPMLTVTIFVILPIPLMFFANSNSSSLISSDSDSWADFTKFLTGASVVGGIAIPSILRHAGIISLGALIMELSSFSILGLAVLLFLVMNRDDGDNMF